MIHQEISFETAIEQALVHDGGGYEAGTAAFDAERGMFPEDVLDFLAKSQVPRWEYLGRLLGETRATVVLDALGKELEAKGLLYVLRQGFKCYGKTLRLAFFKPNTQLNPDAQKHYAFSRLRLHRQVHASPGRPGQSVDVVLALNGLPVATMELKNPLSGQNYQHAQHQYRTDRNPQDALFRFKSGALVHFALDPDQAWMTTRLAGADTYFLPFNQGYRNGAGNPPSAVNDYRTAYLWNEVLQRDSMMDIIARFAHIQTTEHQVRGADEIVRIVRRETLIFPRYHQLQAVRALVTAARDQGAGRHYLVQHSAGSGKSNSIAWLAHRLASLHDAQDERVFDTVVVITDRRVLDRQLQDAIYQFEHKQGVVQKIDEDTQQLAKALAGGVPVIISTIQKFPYIAQALNTLAKKGPAVRIQTAGRRFAVIVDEAHSSQSGEAAQELRKILNQDGIEAALASQLLDLDEDELSEEARQALLRDLMRRPRQPNISYFAFTATPKFRTLAVFDEPGPNGKAPFHHYSMKQAIEEGFILDVLANYTTYQTYYGLVKRTQDDPELPRREAALGLARFMSLHPYNIAQKVEVIVEHFKRYVIHRIGGRAKAMVVTSSRLHAVRYKLAFDAYVKEKGYTDIRSLVAFSGTVEDPDLAGSRYTEPGMNDGLRESELPDRFASDDYQVLLVADKYQTGFDQPLLHTMYVDKRLAGIQAVQTLSRLNRTAHGKTDTFVLDFVNEREEIFNAFKPYYETTERGDEPDPHQLYALQHRLEEARVWEPEEVTALCEVWYRRGPLEPSAQDHKRINALLDQAVTRFEALPPADQTLFKSNLVSFRNLYTFLAQIIPYQDSGLEKLHVYARFLLTKLPRRDTDPRYRADDDVALKYYRLEKVSEGSIPLGVGEPSALYGPGAVGTAERREQVVNLSELIDRLNERFGTEFTLADQLFFEQVAETAVASNRLREVAQANTLPDFTQVVEKMLESLFLERMEGNEEVFSRVLGSGKLRAVAVKHIAAEVYRKLRAGSS